MMYEKNKSNKVTIRLSDQDYSFINDLALFYDISVSDLIRFIITKYRLRIEGESNGN